LDIKERLDREVFLRNSETEISLERPDPLLIARQHNDEYVALLSALFGYGKASAIVKFLYSLDFSLLNSRNYRRMESSLSGLKYRFQNGKDILAIFKALRNMQLEGVSIEEIFKFGYIENRSVVEGIDRVISEIESAYPYKSKGYQFLIGQRYSGKISGVSPYKRWNMYLRWMVRKDNLDMGLWSGIDRSDLIIPLDTHTFKVSQQLGLLKRKTYDLKSAILLTEKLREFDPEDPVKYDFALYRIGQESLLEDEEK
jgi:uncharacterized protein (TIGR02757 family)